MTLLKGGEVHWRLRAPQAEFSPLLQYGKHGKPAPDLHVGGPRVPPPCVVAESW